MENEKTTSNRTHTSFWNAITNTIFGKGWETVSAPSNARCKIYSEQAEYAQDELKKETLSRRDRRFWKKQQDKAMKGLADVHYTNCNHFVALACGIGASLILIKQLMAKN